MPSIFPLTRSATPSRRRRLEESVVSLPLAIELPSKARLQDRRRRYKRGQVPRNI